MERPLVSVVLCSYNGAGFLGSQIDSILSQTWQPLELVISDDASTDDTPSILKNYETHPSVRIFYQEQNLGLGRNFDFAAAQAKGKLIAFSDQDDIWVKDKIEKLVNAMDDRPLVYSDSWLVDEKAQGLGKKLSDLKRMYSGDDSRGYILYSCVWGHGMLITRELLEKSQPIPAEVHHDIWLAFQAFLHGGIKYLDEPLTLYRQHNSSSSITIPQKQRTRKREERYKDYKKKLRWIELMQQHERPEYQPFYQELLRLYVRKEKGYVWPLVSFMLKHREAIFRYSKKGFVSQLLEILKQGRRERC